MHWYSFTVRIDVRLMAEKTDIRTTHIAWEDLLLATITLYNIQTSLNATCCSNTNAANYNGTQSIVYLSLVLSSLQNR